MVLPHATGAAEGGQAGCGREPGAEQRQDPRGRREHGVEVGERAGGDGEGGRRRRGHGKSDKVLERMSVRMIKL